MKLHRVKTEFLSIPNWFHWHILYLTVYQLAVYTEYLWNTIFFTGPKQILFVQVSLYNIPYIAYVLSTE